MASRLSRQLLISHPGYDPSLCKTCQLTGSPHPGTARAPYSDCEEHFNKRVARFLKAGVRVITRSSNIEKLFSL